MSKQEHILATLAATMMALLLAFGMQFLKVSKQLDRKILELFSPLGLSSVTAEIGPEVLWSATLIACLLLAASILSIPKQWQRLFIWMLAVCLSFAWAPVLILASYAPNLSTGTTAIIWAGFCAICYRNAKSA